MVNTYIDKHSDKFISELFELLSIPSISADSGYATSMDDCASWLSGALSRAGADRVQVYATDGPSIVYGEKLIDPAAPTVLVYGHYDVMPVDPLELWNTDPFKPVIRDGRIWGRGSDDDKGQSFMHIKALEAMVATGTLKCNVKFMLEGQEEIGSGELTRWVAQHKEMLRADVILVSDTSLLGFDTPSITCGLRGLAYVEVEVKAANRDLHSGLYGGAVANPINVLSKMVGSLVDDYGRITIGGFYDDVQEFSAAQRVAINSAPFDEQRFRSSIGVTDLVGEDGYTTMERKGTRPTLEVCGILGGYLGEGAKT
ncbi:MAG: M20/M25/M40 family metallo-hydrolase, partial [Mucinivorans sp.]